MVDLKTNINLSSNGIDGAAQHTTKKYKKKKNIMMW